MHQFDWSMLKMYAVWLNLSNNYCDCLSRIWLIKGGCPVPISAARPIHTVDRIQIYSVSSRPRRCELTGSARTGANSVILSLPPPYYPTPPLAFWYERQRVLGQPDNHRYNNQFVNYSPVLLSLVTRKTAILAEINIVSQIGYFFILPSHLAVPMRVLVCNSFTST